MYNLIFTFLIQRSIIVNIYFVYKTALTNIIITVTYDV